MKAEWLGTSEELMNVREASLLDALTEEEKRCCFSALSALTDTKIALDVATSEGKIHCIVNRSYYWLALQFAPGTTVLASDVDRLSLELSELSSADALLGKKIFSAVVLLGDGAQVFQEQKRALPIERLQSYIDALDHAAGQVDADQMPGFEVPEANLLRAKSREKQREKAVEILIDHLLAGHFAEAKKLASDLQRVGQALYITTEIEKVRAYFQQRGEEQTELLFSPKAYNLRHLRKKESTEIFELPARRRLAFIAWGDDLRWTGRWKAQGSEEEQQRAIVQFYRDMLVSGEIGSLIYVPAESEMRGSYRALENAGFLPL